MFNERSLTKVGNTIGKMVKVDLQTEEIARGKFARICVELDLSKPLTAKVGVVGKLLVVEYEGLQKICFQCGKFGHNTGGCPQLKPNAEPIRAQSNGDTVSMEENRGTTVDKEHQPTYGIWMLPAYARRKYQQN